MSKGKLVLILLGPPGAGKGTYCNRLVEKYETPQISTGDLFRSAIALDNELGRTVKDDLAKGILVPDEIVNKVVLQRIQQPDCEKGFILDGYPRAVSQAGNLDRLLFHDNDTRINGVIYLDVPEEVIMQRLTGRRMCTKCTKGNFNIYTMKPQVEGKCDFCGADLYQRDDDKEDVIRKRLDTYKAQTEPLISFYRARGQLRTVPYEGSVDDMSAVIYDHIDKGFKDLEDIGGLQAK